MKIKILITTMLTIPVLSYAGTTIHQNKFSIQQAAEGEHFWARIYDWKAWAQTPEQKKLKLSTNFVKKAFDEKHPRIEENKLSEGDLVNLLGADEGEALYDFYANRKEVDPEYIKTISGATTAMKVAVDLPADFDIQNLKLEDIYSLISKGDNPHIHQEVSKSFAASFIDPVHAGQKETRDLNEGMIVLSILNMGEDYYNCARLNDPLVLKGEIEGVSDFDGNFRVYMLNTVKEVPVDANLGKVSLVEGKPLRVFEQKVVYSSTLLKSGVNHLAFYSLPNGKKKMVLNAVLVSTDQVLSAPGTYVNGVSLGNLVLGGSVELKNGTAVLNSKNVDLSPLSGSCSKGLAQGVGRYVFGLAKGIAQ